MGKGSLRLPSECKGLLLKTLKGAGKCGRAWGTHWRMWEKWLRYRVDWWCKLWAQAGRSATSRLLSGPAPRPYH